MAEPDAAPAPPKGEAAPPAPAKAAEPAAEAAAEARKPERALAPAAPGFGGRILPYVLVWLAVAYGRDMLAGPQQVEKAPDAPSAARAPPIHHRDAVDEEFAEFASAEAAPAEAKPVAAAEPVEAVPAVPRSAATNVLVRLCTS
mmetsp:Transcript_14300/g.37929  ORF Transcript_14300/g.37929 Transcript_14300/m.37929 type:complete len:144 (+) Transcript_14300:99-530(+)